jgi:catechol 2,3-dioxygenase-like lactoylglutathione lyase family enzyme
VSIPLFNHVSVTCVDLDRSLTFYHDMLGLPVIDHGERSSAVLQSIIGPGPIRQDDDHAYPAARSVPGIAYVT